MTKHVARNITYKPWFLPPILGNGVQVHFKIKKLHLFVSKYVLHYSHIRMVLSYSPMQLYLLLNEINDTLIDNLFHNIIGSQKTSTNVQ